MCSFILCHVHLLPVLLAWNTIGAILYHQCERESIKLTYFRQLTAQSSETQIMEDGLLLNPGSA